MRLHIEHRTEYSYTQAASYALLQLRMRPKSTATQTVKAWDMTLDGAKHHAQFTDQYGTEIDLIEPRIPFRETIKGNGEAKYRHKKQSGGAGQFAEVWMRIEPTERDSGIDFTHSLVGQNVDRVFVASVEKGVNAACEEGILAGYRVVDVKIDFYDG